jgi:hypothetical protein
VGRPTNIAEKLSASTCMVEGHTYIPECSRSCTEFLLPLQMQLSALFRFPGRNTYVNGDLENEPFSVFYTHEPRSQSMKCDTM